jgi:hypothetical protein
MITRLMFVFLALGVLCDAGTQPGFTIDFESFETSVTPPGFTTSVTGAGGDAVWVVSEEPDVPSGKRALLQTSADSTSYRFPLCVRDGFTAADVDVGVKFKAISGSVDQAAGIVWRYQNRDNYYVVRANALEDNVVLYKVENGKRSDLKPTDAGWLFTYGKKVDVPTGEWNELRVTARGRRFEVFLNDKHLFDVEDATFMGSGKVGLWTKADSVTAFDDLIVRPLEKR